MIRNMKKREPDKFFNVILNSIADGVFSAGRQGKQRHGHVI